MKKFLPPLLLTGLVFLVYGNTWNHSFHFDDIHSILEKPWIRGLDKIPQFIFSYSQRPVVILSLNFNYAISEFEVWSYHLFNILFHVLATLLVYRLARMIQDTIRPTTTSPISLPLLTAMIFALHPLNTQAVTYISSRTSELATVFYLLTMILFFKGLGLKRDDAEAIPPVRSPVRLALAGLCFVLGLGSKLIILSVPAMLFLYHYHFVSRQSAGRWLKSQVRWIALAAIPLVAVVVYKQFFAGGLLKTSPTGISTATWFLTQTQVVPFEYFRKMLFPFNLNIDIAFPLISDWADPANWKGLLVLGLYVALWYGLSRRSEGWTNSGLRQWAGFGLAWMLITLTPTSTFVPLLDPAVEHRTYLPMVGFAFFAAAALTGLGNILSTRTASGFLIPPAGGRLVTGCVLVILVALGAGTVVRNKVWASEVTLWSDAKKKSPRLLRPYNNLGQAYDQMGEYDKAIAEFEAALKVDPKYFFALNNLGNIYGKKRDIPRAIDYFQKALEVRPKYAAGHYNLAKALHMTGKREEAAEAYRRAIGYNAYFEKAMYNLGFLALELGRAQEAIANFEKFLEMQPGHVKARFGLGNAYSMNRQWESALREYQHALELDPGFIAPRINIANVQMQMGQLDQAIHTFQQILDRQPQNAGVHKNLGLIFLQYKKDRDQAVFHFNEYLRLNPNAPDSMAVRAMVGQLKGQIPG